MVRQTREKPITSDPKETDKLRAYKRITFLVENDFESINDLIINNWILLTKQSICWFHKSQNHSISILLAYSSISSNSSISSSSSSYPTYFTAFYSSSINKSILNYSPSSSLNFFLSLFSYFSSFKQSTLGYPPSWIPFADSQINPFFLSPILHLSAFTFLNKIPVQGFVSLHLIKIGVRRLSKTVIFSRVIFLTSIRGCVKQVPLGSNG